MTRTRRTPTAVAALAALAMLITACTTNNDGEPEPANNNGAHDEQHNDTDLPHSGAPAVENPLDTARFEDDPCLALTDQQLAEAGYDYEEAETEVTDDNVSLCRWSMGLGEGRFVVAYTLNNPEGLSGVYQDHEAEEWELFDETEAIHGYPALLADQVDSRDRGRCNIIVGVRDELAVWVTMSAGPSSDAPFQGEGEACEAAYELAELAVETMKGDS
ncbi:DUF3558 domain-containing protein [Haloechinothrix sp. LS1_15]|uniref:DUF3558 domain-containing protein n=1 Tax=Haloechinothrix sp. LS1_15 TaxID=2652248 RepID=UPI002944BACC|nr:DUF3558 domain-containing protein [Haloechinothrix sp. LS1_15]MDV6012565.1 DUF3558 domain-containing protein [Haloechinothrix sp. LS1_15]